MLKHLSDKSWKPRERIEIAYLDESTIAEIIISANQMLDCDYGIGFKGKQIIDGIADYVIKTRSISKKQYEIFTNKEDQCFRFFLKKRLEQSGQISYAKDCTQSGAEQPIGR